MEKLTRMLCVYKQIIQIEFSSEVVLPIIKLTRINVSLHNSLSILRTIFGYRSRAQNYTACIESSIYLGYEFVRASKQFNVLNINYKTNFSHISEKM